MLTWAVGVGATGVPSSAPGGWGCFAAFIVVPVARRLLPHRTALLRDHRPLTVAASVFVLHAVLFALLLSAAPAAAGLAIVLVVWTILSHAGLSLRLVDGQPPEGRGQIVRIALEDDDEKGHGPGARRERRGEWPIRAGWRHLRWTTLPP